MSGSSAGMHVLGLIDYTGIRGSAESPKVLQNPLDKTISEINYRTDAPADQVASYQDGPVPWLPVKMFDSSFLNVQTGVMDTHFYERNRMGRWLIFMAKNNCSGIAASEATAYIQVPESNDADVLSNDGISAVYKSTGVNIPQLNNGPFSGNAPIECFKKRQGLQPYNLTVQNGQITSNRPDGLIYGPDFPNK